MTRAIYAPEDFGVEVVAPSGYYVPLEAAFAEYAGRRLLYILGNYCIEASCCGVGSWNYLRVEGYVLRMPDPEARAPEAHFEIETIESELEKKEIGRLLLDRHPGVRIEFRQAHAERSWDGEGIGS
ncbi:MAG: hypothetical protein JW990_00500 [Thermoleophilia bacterium]|nr:hypothetical protein [Thermoleophilia bacterium]